MRTDGVALSVFEDLGSEFDAVELRNVHPTQREHGRDLEDMINVERLLHSSFVRVANNLVGGYAAANSRDISDWNYVPGYSDI